MMEVQTQTATSHWEVTAKVNWTAFEYDESREQFKIPSLRIFWEITVKEWFPRVILVWLGVLPFQNL